ncbi:chitinase [Massilia sp. erpn]|nr:chitinase [Massilia sp. erpn]
MQSKMIFSATVLAALLAGCGGGNAPAGDNAGAERARSAAAPQRAAPAKMVLAYYSGYANNYKALTTHYANFNAVAIDYWNITAEGVVVGNGDPAPSNAISFLKSKKIPIYGCISNVDGDWSQAIAHGVTGTFRKTAIANLLAFAKKNGFAGINIDFENVNKDDRANLSAFTAELGAVLHANGLKLIISVPAFSAADENHEYNQAFDLAALGRAVDYIQIMSYDQAIPAWDPGPVASSGWMEDALDYAVAKAPAGRILNGLPAYGYDWIAAGNGKQVFWNAIPGMLKQYGVTPRYDIGSNSLTFNYTATDGQPHTVWTENAQSITLKASLVNAYGLGGTSIYALGMEDASYWKAVQAGLQK